MAVKYSQTSKRKLNPCSNKRCKACGLYLNQQPIFDNRKQSSIFWVGLSAVQFTEEEIMLPLSPNTRSGALIQQIEQPFSNKIAFYKTNLVKCVPLKDDKIRYPLEHEMNKCYPNLLDEIQESTPSIIFLLGKQVASFVLKKETDCDFRLDDDFNYQTFESNGVFYIPVHHPSYILVYKRKYLDRYISSIQSHFFASLQNRITVKAEYV
jgi:DNA polymerase